MPQSAAWTTARSEAGRSGMAGQQWKSPGGQASAVALHGPGAGVEEAAGRVGDVGGGVGVGRPRAGPGLDVGAGRDAAGAGAGSQFGATLPAAPPAEGGELLAAGRAVLAVVARSA